MRSSDEYVSLPLGILREIAAEKGIVINFHPALTKLSKGEKIVEIKESSRKEILQVIMEWNETQ